MPPVTRPPWANRYRESKTTARFANSASAKQQYRSAYRQSSQTFGPNIFTQELPEPTAEIRGSGCLVRVNMPGSQLPTRQVTDTDIRALERFLRDANRQADRERPCRVDFRRAIEGQGDPFDDFTRDVDGLQDLSLAELLALAAAALLL